MAPEEGIASATCEICGADFRIGIHNRCEKCGAICCRDCLKISYSTSPDGRTTVRRVLCYHCHHDLKNHGSA